MRTARDLMTTDVATIAPSATVAEAARLMVERGVSGLPVVENNGLVVGIVTEGDLLRRVELGTETRDRWWLIPLTEGAALDYRKTHGRTVREVMTRPVFGVPPTASLRQIAQLMETHGIKRVPVLEAGRLLGIVSRADVVRELARRGGVGGHGQAVLPAP